MTINIHVDNYIGLQMTSANLFKDNIKYLYFLQFSITKDILV